MTHAILIIAHKYPKMLIPLIEYFRKDCVVYIHYDRNALLTETEVTRLCSYPQVKGLYQKIAVHWGGYSVLQAELFLLQQAYNDGVADYYHLISGQDYPVKPLQEFLSFLSAHSGKDFIEYKTMDIEGDDKDVMRRLFIFQPHNLINARTREGIHIVSAWNNHQLKNGFRRTPPRYFAQYYKGSQWFSITSSSACLLLEQSPSNIALLRHLKYGFAPEECYVPTVLMNSSRPHEVINNNLRYIRWYGENGNNPSNLGIEHFNELRKTDAFFARKMEPPYCRSLIQSINTNLLYG